jgi:dTDP-4-amino-4,6-dideoxygalactose transaminase
MTPTIPLVDIAAQQAEIHAEVMPEIERVLTTAYFVGGPDVAAFEDAYGDFVGVRHCIGVSNGTDALELALRAAGLGPGDEAIVPANTFFATAEAVVRTGATPVFVDVDDEYLLIDPTVLEAALTPRVKVVVPVHLFGQAAPVDGVLDVLDGRPVTVVEDAAQSQGARRHGRSTGTLGLVAGTSFYPGKNLGASGDAGAVLTDDEDVARTVRLLANHGSLQKYVHEVVGLNARLDALHAVVLSAKLRRLKAWNAVRAEAAARYTELLAGIPEVRTPSVAPGNEHVWHLYVIRVPRRDEVLARLNEAGVGAAIHYPQALHRTAPFAQGQASLPVSERAADEILSLPLHPHLSADQQERVVSTLCEALGHRSARPVVVP